MSRARPRWAAMLSGRGSNLAALLDLEDEIDLRLVVSSKASAVGLCRARKAGLPTMVLDKKTNWPELDQVLRCYRIDAIFLLGFMKILPESFLREWKGRIINLHPSLLPTYPGLESLARAHADQAAMGATIHEVVKEVDAGQILLQRKSVSAEKVASVALERAETWVHVDEQRLVREIAQKWRPR